MLLKRQRRRVHRRTDGHGLGGRRWRWRRNGLDRIVWVRNGYGNDGGGVWGSNWDLWYCLLLLLLLLLWEGQPKIRWRPRGGRNESAGQNWTHWQWVCCTGQMLRLHELVQCSLRYMRYQPYKSNNVKYLFFNICNIWKTIFILTFLFFINTNCVLSNTHIVSNRLLYSFLNFSIDFDSL